MSFHTEQLSSHVYRLQEHYSPDQCIFLNTTQDCTVEIGTGV